MRVLPALFTLLFSIASVLANTEIVHFSYDGSQQQSALLPADVLEKLNSKVLASPHGALDMEEIATEQSSRSDKERWYLLSNLEDGSSYELRLSYSATSPTDYQVTVFSLDEVAAMYNFTGAQSILVDIVQDAAMLARVTARHVGVSNVVVPDQELTQFNIALDKLVFGVPTQAFRLALIILAVVLFSVFWAVPKAASMIDSVVHSEYVPGNATSKKQF